ncbi:hypothetical protein CANTEDRAFT_114667 [Yamadazyma tenuis ATCC 10573]|uniref:Uncharacterized protein n=1 Tax=Candida tenuis (strain ATCC 10573 / BCRC 21748 / CBS 615 / JCM 9827 / NBRC 10315 / NRRL Y-1498 / VKM Y-70) TaxID=590646 RepID=G3B618_CANTC|nr:uncharacterized protein CANTEDRAFT_114667 [Yamadazyma tenuis ATCC 10573]EGV63357.1 hypothetical protein CANTEDRAFT_114667 [Yamadazyma tenuis ATCC 10573]
MCQNRPPAVKRTSVCRGDTDVLCLQAPNGPVRSLYVFVTCTTPTPTTRCATRRFFLKKSSYSHYFKLP